MSKGRILVVDDEEDILELVKYNLEREGYLVDCVEKSAQRSKHSCREQLSSELILCPSKTLSNDLI